MTHAATLRHMTTAPNNQMPPVENTRMPTPDKTRLLEILADKSFRYSAEPVFKLASGTMSNYYVDCRVTTHAAEGKVLIGPIIHAMIRDRQVAAVGGMTMGADPIACAVSYAATLAGEPIASFSIRKEPKGHGMGKQVEGDVAAGALDARQREQRDCGRHLERR